MLRYVADENFNNDIIWGLLRRNSELDIVRIQDVGLASADDPAVLTWAADTGRLLLTHDVKTITRYAYERVALGQSMPGVVEVSQFIPISLAIDDLLLLAEVSIENEWQGQVLYLPLRQ
jgi:hypothetical protein